MQRTLLRVAAPIQVIPWLSKPSFKFKHFHHLTLRVVLTWSSYTYGKNWKREPKLTTHWAKAKLQNEAHVLTYFYAINGKEKHKTPTIEMNTTPKVLTRNNSRTKTCATDHVTLYKSAIRAWPLVGPNNFSRSKLSCSPVSFSVSTALNGHEVVLLNFWE